MNPHFFTAPFLLGVRGRVLAVRRVLFYGFRRFNGDYAAHFVILSGEKRRMLKNGLSEI